MTRQTKSYFKAGDFSVDDKYTFSWQWKQIFIHIQENYKSSSIALANY